jgi:hypothetical protein
MLAALGAVFGLPRRAAPREDLEAGIAAVAAVFVPARGAVSAAAARRPAVERTGAHRFTSWGADSGATDEEGRQAQANTMLKASATSNRR